MSAHTSTGPGTESCICATEDNPVALRPDASCRLPLTSGQRELWVGQQLDPDSRAFNAGGYAMIKGPLNVEMFQQATAACIAETEGLRLRLLSDMHGPYQVVSPQAGVALQYIDLSEEPDAVNAAMMWMRTEINKELRLDRGQTFSWALLHLAPEHFIFCTIYHHVVIDGMSSIVLLRRIRHLYEAIRTSTTAKPVQYASIASMVEAEEVYRSSDRFAADRVYWIDQLKDRSGPLSLSRKSRNHTITWESHRESTSLASEAVDGLQKLADQLKTSLPRTMMGAVTMVVNQLTGSYDFLLGMVVTGRGGRFRSIPANLTNILPLRLRLSRGMCLRDCIQLAAQAMEGASTHKFYQQNDMRSDLGLRPNDPGLIGIEVNIMPLFFFTDHESGLDWSIHGLSPGPVEDLSISICERGEDGRLRIDFNGNKNRFEEAELSQMASRFNALLSSVATAPPDATLSQTAVLPSERQPAIEETNQSREWLRPQPLPELFEAQVDRTPQAVALSFAENSLTYENLDAAANRLGRGLIARGVGTEDVVALLLPRGTELVVSMIGIVKAGAAYLPLDVDHPAGRLLFMLQDSGARLVVTTTEILKQLPLLSAFSLLLIDDLEQRQALASMSSHRVRDAERVRPLGVRNLIYVIYTSGSTGEPKGVAIEHSTFSVQMKKMVRCIPMRSDETILAITTVTFDPAGFEVFLPLLQGASLTLLNSLDSRDPIRVAAKVAALGACVLQATPTFWRALFGCGIPRTVRAFVGGEALPADLVKQFLEFPEATNLYGPTETTVDSGFHKIVAEDAERYPVVTIGRPLEGEQFYILDVNLEPVGDGAIGELYIAGSGLARGYLNRPALTLERFVQCPFAQPAAPENESRMYRTGDLARWRANGEVDYLGRADQQVKIRGIRIEPGEVEAVLLRSVREIKECAVVARELRGQVQLIAYYTNAAGALAPAAPQMRDVLLKLLPEAMVPGIFVRLDTMPLTPNAKLDRNALPDPGVHFDPNRFLPPSTMEESVICGVFADLTGASRVSRADDFFQLGGHSLAAVLCVHRLQRELHCDLSLRQLFETPTPEGLARSISRNGKTPVPARVSASSLPLLFLLPGVCGDEPRLVRFRVQCKSALRIVLLTYPDWRLMIEPKTGAELLLKHLLRQIEMEAPQGPIRLLGYSFGGYCSHAMAKELSRVGRETEFAGLLDASAQTDLPIMLSTQLQTGVSPMRAGWFLIQDVGRLVRAIGRRELGRVSALIVVRWLNWPPLKRLLSLATNARPKWLPSSFHYYLNHYFQESTRVAAMKGWYASLNQGAPKLSAPAFLFRSEDHNPEEPQDLGWRRYFNFVSTINLNGTHHTMLDPPHLTTLCDEICSLLAGEPVRG